MKNIPVYKITIDEEYSEGEDLGWLKTAFTKRPAIIVKGMAFSSDLKHKEMIFTDAVKQRIAAPVMIPSTIYRNENGEEFYVEFTEKEIEKIHSKFMKNFGKNKNLFNLEHTDETVPAYMLECWLVDTPEKDKSYSTYGIKVPKGSLFMVAQITDKEYYNMLVENDQIGFSIEGFLGLSLSMSENNNNKIKMENEMKLPEGTKIQIQDKWFIVKNGEIVEYEYEKEEVSMTKEKEEELEMGSKEKKEEEVEMQEEEEEVVTEEVVTEETPMMETYSKEEIDAKFEEIYKMIAELKSESTEEIKEEIIEEVQLSAHDRFAEFIRFSKNN